MTASPRAGREGAMDAIVLALGIVIALAGGIVVGYVAPGRARGPREARRALDARDPSAPARRAARRTLGHPRATRPQAHRPRTRARGQPRGALPGGAGGGRGPGAGRPG